MLRISEKSELWYKRSHLEILGSAILAGEMQAERTGPCVAHREGALLGQGGQDEPGLPGGQVDHPAQRPFGEGAGRAAAPSGPPLLVGLHRDGHRRLGGRPGRHGRRPLQDRDPQDRQFWLPHPAEMRHQ